MRFDDHYARAVRTKNLRSRPETLRSSADIVGAAGLAAQKQALAMALLRFFTGDNRESKQIVAIMADMAWGKAHSEKVKLYRTQAESMAQTVFDWMRDPACRTCKGLQFKLMESKPVLSTHRCPKCKGKGLVASGFKEQKLCPSCNGVGYNEREATTSKGGKHGQQGTGKDR